MNGQVNRTYKCYVILILFVSDHLINIQYELILSESKQMKKYKINKIKPVFSSSVFVFMDMKLLISSTFTS